MIYFITAAFSLAIGFLIFVPMCIFEQVGAQLLSTPSLPTMNSSSSLPTMNSSSSNTAARVTSAPTRGTLVPSTQLKASIFEDLARCISAHTCRPTIGSVGDDRIVGGNGSNVIMGLEGNDIIRGGP